jgi:outer membrane protein assembly factor BamB
LAVAADGNVYVAGIAHGPADFGAGLQFGSGGFVFALDRDGEHRWLQHVLNPKAISAATPGRVRIQTAAAQQDDPSSEDSSGRAKALGDLVELDAADGTERWVKRLVTGSYWPGDVDSDALGRTVFSSVVWDDAKLAGKPVSRSTEGLWASLIALDPEHKLMWTHTLLPQGPSSFQFLDVMLTPSGQLFLAGHCDEPCKLTGDFPREGSFLLRMRL